MIIILTFQQHFKLYKHSMLFIHNISVNFFCQSIIKQKFKAELCLHWYIISECSLVILGTNHTDIYFKILRCEHVFHFCPAIILAAFKKV